MNFEKIFKPKQTERQEKSDDGSQHEKPDLPKGKILQWLREKKLMTYLVGGLSFASAYEHKPASAAEIPPDANFYQGITALQDQAIHGTNEVGATFFIREGAEHGEWPHQKIGGRTQVTVNLKNISGAILDSLPKDRDESIKLRICQFHTHPIAAGIKVGIITQQDANAIKSGVHTVALPPSGSDISLFNAANINFSLKKKLEEANTTVQINKGVVDSAGITYHRIITEEDRTKHFPQYAAEVNDKRKFFDRWELAIRNFLASLDDAALNKMHALTEEKNKYVQGTLYYKRLFNEIRRFKEGDIYIKLMTNTKDGDELMQLISAHPDVVELQAEMNNWTIKDAAEREKFKTARAEWRKLSMTMEADKLRNTPTYKNLQEAYARAGAMIRFVPHTEVANEPPCAGVDYNRNE